MRDLAAHLPEILARIRRQGAVLFLDFDGTLAPIVPDPQQASLGVRTRKLVVACSRRYRVVIISGRSLEDIRARVGIPRLWYAGNHGLEWWIDGRAGSTSIPSPMARAIRDIRRGLNAISSRYPGLYVEDKRLTLVVRFENIPSSKRAACRRTVETLMKPFVKKALLRILRKPLDFDIRPRVPWHKGYMARFLLSHVAHWGGKAVLPIFIGDDTTDEDAFRMLPGAITILVGKRRRSAARYRVSGQDAVNDLLATLLHVEQVRR